MSTPRLRAYLYSIFTGKFEGVFAFNLDDDFTNRLVLKLMHLLNFLFLWCQRQALIFKMCLFISPISLLGVLFLFSSFEHKN